MSLAQKMPVPLINPDPTIFREYDMRGVAFANLDEAVVAAIGRAFAAMLRERAPEARRVAVGYDGRVSSPALEAALIEGLVSGGMDVVRVGLGPTPMLYHATYALRADAGIMVTGSHNPPDQNGLKCLMGKAPFYGKDIQELRLRIRTGVAAAPARGNVSDHPMEAAYVAMLAQAMRPGRSVRVAWDPANGAAGDALKALLTTLPGQHHCINMPIDGTFPAHHADPTEPENLEQLVELVHEHQCELGIAFDGDGDRIGVVDETGAIWWGDQLMQLFAADVLAESPGSTIIADVKASQHLFDRIAQLGGKPMMWKTGHSLIKAKMAEIQAPLAGEMSGHIFFAANHGFDDALYAAVRLLSFLASSERRLADYRRDLPVAINTPELRIPCAESEKFAIVEQVKASLRAEGAQVSEVDGVRVQTADGWWLLRASNTQAVLVARAEAHDREALGRLTDALAQRLAGFGLLLPL